MSQEIFDEAMAAAKKALEGAKDEGACGFAWVQVRPARGPFIDFCKAQILVLGLKYDQAGNLRTIAGGTPTHAQWTAAKSFGQRDDHKGGWQFWNPGGYPGQAVHAKEAAAIAFAAVLTRHGIKAGYGSRLD